jgi:hypothetical protein
MATARFARPPGWMKKNAAYAIEIRAIFGQDAEFYIIDFTRVERIFS